MPDTQAVFLDLDSVSHNDMDLTPLESTTPNWNYFNLTTPEQTGTHIGQAEVVVSNKVVLNRETLQGSANIKLICIAATGTNNVDLVAAKELGITVTNVAGYSTPSVVQQVFAMILNLITRQTEYAHAIRDNRWQQSEQFCLLDFPFREIGGKTLGIVGYGGLGRAVARVAESFGMRVMLAQRPGGPDQDGRVPLDEMLPQVDVLSLHCPLTPETQNLIGGKELAKMKSDALLINCARGGIVDEMALAQALRNGELGGAGVDVLAVEPPTSGNPLLDPSIPNLLLTPHIAWASRESRQRLINEIAKNILAFYAGEKRNIVA